MKSFRQYTEEMTPPESPEKNVEDKNLKCEVIEKPFYDPKKQITSKSL